MPREKYKVGDIVAYKFPVYADIFTGEVMEVKKSGVPWIRPHIPHKSSFDRSTEHDERGYITIRSTVINITARLANKGLKISNDLNAF